MKNNQEKEESSMIGRKGIVHDEEGNEVIGEVVFARKANYKKPSWILELEESECNEKER